MTRLPADRLCLYRDLSSCSLHAPVVGRDLIGAWLKGLVTVLSDRPAVRAIRSVRGRDGGVNDAKEFGGAQTGPVGGGGDRWGGHSWRYACGCGVGPGGWVVGDGDRAGD